MENKYCKSIMIRKFGGLDVLQVKSLKLPKIDDMLEVKVKYCGLNFADLYMRQGLMNKVAAPFILGMECVGIITDIGTSAKTELMIGQRVICYNYKGGMYREIVRVPPELCYPVPDYIPDNEAAAILVNYLTAYFSCCQMGALRPNQTILIMSCGGGVGVAATQLAKAVDGVKVYGIVSRGKEEQVQQNGVDVVIPRDEFATTAKMVCPEGFDLIIANELGSTFSVLQTLLRPLGRIMLLGANNFLHDYQKVTVWRTFRELISIKSIDINTIIYRNNLIGGLHLGTLLENSPQIVRAALEDMFIRYKEGKIKPIIDSVYPFDEIVEATKRLTERKNVGKVLLEIS